MRRYLALGAALACAACTSGQSGTDAGQQRGGGVVTVWTDVSELFFEHPALIAGEESTPWAVHVTDLRTFGPVPEGSVTLELTGADGQTYRTHVPAPSRPGVYEPRVAVPTAGTYDLVVTISGAQLTDEIFVGPIYVYPSAAALPTNPPEPETGITHLKEQQWTMPFATAEASRRVVPRSIEAPGDIVPATASIAHISAPVIGLLPTGRNRTAPSPGDRVRTGDLLAVIAPTDDEGSYAGLVARVERLEREAARAERLFRAEAIPERRLQEARHDLEVARAALQALGGRGESGYELALRAPFDGVVAERSLVAGGRVEAGDRLFTIIDPSTVWLRLHVPAAHAGALGGVTGATFTVEGSERVFRAERLVAVGDVIDPERRTLPVTFAVRNGDRALKVGALALGRVLLGDPQRGLVIPTRAVRDEDGVPVAYVQVSGELFQRRVLTLGASDGEWTVVKTGVSAGERVVTVGAYQVRLASLNPDAVSDHGHPH